MSELLLYPDENGVLHEAPEFRTVVCFETKEEQERFEKRINNMNKYKWHDLRKNPHDFPEKEGQYFCCIKIHENPSWGIEECIFYDVLGNKGDGRPFTDTTLTETIAWREIEPYEEEDV